MSLEDERRAAMQNIAQLERRIDSHELEIHAMETIPASLTAIHEQLRKIDRRLDDGEREMKSMKAVLDANTVITTDVRDAQIAGKVVTNLVKWLASFILACGVIGTAIYQALHSGNLPPGAGK